MVNSIDIDGLFAGKSKYAKDKNGGKVTRLPDWAILGLLGHS
jgi:hypothetical protein